MEKSVNTGPIDVQGQAPGSYRVAGSPQHAGAGTKATADRLDPVPALLLGGGVTAVATLRCLRRAGIPVFCAEVDDPYLRRSRWYRPARGPSESPIPPNLFDYLRALPIASAVVIPCSDTWMAAVVDLPSDLAERFFTSLPSAEMVRRLSDKLTLGGLLNELNIPHPRSMPIVGEHQLRKAIVAVTGSCFLKPRNSQKFHDRFNVKAFLVEHPPEAMERYREIKAAGLDVIIQEYIPGPTSNHVYVEGFVNRHGEPQAWFARRRLRIWPPLFGNSTYMESVSLSSVAPAVNSMRSILRATRFRGVFSAEFKYDERDGVFKLLEVNIRPWWYIEVPYRCGINMAEMIYLDALGRDVQWTCAYRVGRRFFSPYYDFDPCFQQWKSGHLSLGAWLKSWLRGQLVFFAWDDPMPTVLSSLKMVFRKLGRTLLRNQRPKAAGSKSE